MSCLYHRVYPGENMEMNVYPVDFEEYSSARVLL